MPCRQSLSSPTAKISTRSTESATGFKRCKEEIPILSLRCSVISKNIFFHFKHKKKLYFYTTSNHFCIALQAKFPLLKCDSACSFQLVFILAFQFSFTVHFSKGYHRHVFFCGTEKTCHETGGENEKLYVFYKYLLESESRCWDISNFPRTLK